MKLIKIRSVIALLLMIVLLSGCVAAPGGSAGTIEAVTGKQGDEKAEIPAYLNLTGFPIVKEPITLKVMARKQVTHTNWEDMEMWKKYEEMTGIHIEWITPDQSGYNEKKNLAFASGDYPDAFFKGFLTTSDIISYGSQGILLRLNELIDDYAPNLTAIFDEYPAARKSSVTPDGNIYSLGQIETDPTVLIGSKMFINQKWLNTLGLEKPKTTDDFYEVLKAFKTRDPNGNNLADELPLIGEKGTGAEGAGAQTLITTMMGSWGLGNRGHRMIDLGPDGNIRFVSIDDRYKDFLMYLNKLYVEDLLYKQSFTLERNDALALGPRDIVGSTCNSSIDMLGIVPEKHSEYYATPVLEGPYGDRIYTNYGAIIANLGAFAITDRNKHPEASIRWVDYFYSTEGYNLMYAGIEGVTYTLREDGTPKYTDLILNNPDGLNYNQAIGRYTPLPGGCNPGIYLHSKQLMMSDEQYATSLEVFEQLKDSFPEETWPSFMFTDSENSELTAISTDIHTYVNEMTAKFITGREPFSSWDAYVNTLKNMNLDKYLKIYQSALDRWNKS